MALIKIVDGVRIDCTPKEEKEIRARWKANETPVQKTAYVDYRKNEYPSIADQLDMLWHAMDNGEIPVAMEFHTSISEVKKRNKKPVN